MQHAQAIQYWEHMANNRPNEKTVKVNPQNDYTDIDAEFILKHANGTTRILDLASGTGLTINKYYKKIGHIDAVEKFPELSDFTVKSPKVTVYNEDIVKFSSDKKYDLVLMFGIVQYFNESEIKELYAKYIKYLDSDGVLIIKNQFGVKEDVNVSGVSKELNQPYYSQYRHKDKEVEILKSLGLKTVNVVDIYPPEANRWDNTHFYAIIARGV